MTEYRNYNPAAEAAGREAADEFYRAFAARMAQLGESYAEENYLSESGRSLSSHALEEEAPTDAENGPQAGSFGGGVSSAGAQSEVSPEMAALAVEQLTNALQAAQLATAVFADSWVSATAAVAAGSTNWRTASKQISAAVLMSLAKMAAQKSAFYFWEGVAALAGFNPAAAPGYFAASAGMAAIATGLAVASGKSRGAAKQRQQEFNNSKRESSSRRSGSYGGGSGGYSGSSGSSPQIVINVSGPVDDRALADGMRRGMEAYYRYYPHG